MSMSDQPIGVFDSGVGGLTVVSALMRRLPRESILYLGDTVRLPYGTKSASTVERYTRRNIDFLVDRGVKAVVIACNTASAVTLDDLDLAVPVWGVIEPGAEQAVMDAGNDGIGVLATESTVRSDAYARAIRRLNPRAEVISQPCPLFVPLVEEGWTVDPIAEQVAERYLRPVIDAGCRTLVLGCTHYPLLTEILHKVAGPQIQFVDSAVAVARFVDAQLEQAGLKRKPDSGEGPEPQAAQHHLCVTDLSERFERIAHDLLSHYGSPVDEADRAWKANVSLEWVEV